MNSGDKIFFEMYKHQDTIIVLTEMKVWMLSNGIEGVEDIRDYLDQRIHASKIKLSELREFENES